MADVVTMGEAMAMLTKLAFCTDTSVVILRKGSLSGTQWLPFSRPFLAI